MLFSNKIILGYHKVGKAGIPALEDQIRTLSALGYRIVPLNQVFSTGQPTAVLTFDDGYRDFMFNVFPLLREYDIPATLFVITDTIDKVVPFHKDVGFAADADESDLPLTTEQIKILSGNGIEIGGHTHWHNRLTELSETEALEELAASNNIIRKITSIAPVSFCYPQGFFNRQCWNYLVKSGYKYAVCSYNSKGVTAESRKLLSFQNPYALPRIYPSTKQLLFTFQLLNVARWLYRNSVL